MITIKIVKEINYIEGNRYNVYITGNCSEYMCIANQVKEKDYLELCEALNGLQFRLNQIGRIGKPVSQWTDNVKLVTEEWCDPNFESAADAEEYLMEHPVNPLLNQ